MKLPSLSQVQKLIVTMQQNPLGTVLCLAITSVASIAAVALEALHR